MRCCAWPPRRAPPKIASRRARGAEARFDRWDLLPDCPPQAPLAHLVERRTFNPVGRVRVPHGAYAHRWVVPNTYARGFAQTTRRLHLRSGPALDGIVSNIGWSDAPATATIIASLGCLAYQTPEVT